MELNAAQMPESIAQFVHFINFIDDFDAKLIIYFTSFRMQITSNTGVLCFYIYMRGECRTKWLKRQKRQKRHLSPRYFICCSTSAMLRRFVVFGPETLMPVAGQSYTKNGTACILINSRWHRGWTGLFVMVNCRGPSPGTAIYVIH